MNLSALLVIPLLTALVILLMRRPQQVRWVALLGAIVQCLFCFILVAAYKKEHSTSPADIMYFVQEFDWLPAWNISYKLGVDGISIAMILLTAFVVLSGVLVSWNVGNMTKEFYFLLILLSLGAYGFFLSLDLFMLFFFLEIAVIPKYLLIGIWGSGKKEYSANKLALMLMAGSALVLVGILALYFTSPDKTFDLVKLSQLRLSIRTQEIFFPFLFVGFGIFTALFPFHTWVPDGHSSAPTAGSMFLAGISMKLGSYGCLRVATFLMPDAAREYSPVIIVLSCIAILYGAFATMMQKDLKYLNAYSSVSHCGFILLGIGMLTKTAMIGSVMQMVSHGLMTALFFAVIGMVYDRTHTRLINEMGGLMKVMPMISTAFFIAGLCSLGLPGLSGFAAEITIFIGSWQHPGIFYRTATIIACMSIVVTAVYILRAISQTLMGPLKNPAYSSLKDATWNERIAAIVLIAGILFIGLAPHWLNDLVNGGVDIIAGRFLSK
ncbi:MAG TPA: NADH-quinone oxidoreductase subunit M [Puia sp.]|nr:NADH-quinone oxidoreductase subunit M [Puia sp.]